MFAFLGLCWPFAGSFVFCKAHVACDDLPVLGANPAASSSVDRARPTRWALTNLYRSAPRATGGADLGHARGLDIRFAESDRGAAPDRCAQMRLERIDIARLERGVAMRPPLRLSSRVPCEPSAVSVWPTRSMPHGPWRCSAQVPSRGRGCPATPSGATAVEVARHLAAIVAIQDRCRVTGGVVPARPCRGTDRATRRRHALHAHELVHRDSRRSSLRSGAPGQESGYSLHDDGASGAVLSIATGSRANSSSLCQT